MALESLISVFTRIWYSAAVVLASHFTEFLSKVFNIFLLCRQKKKKTLNFCSSRRFYYQIAGSTSHSRYLICLKLDVCLTVHNQCNDVSNQQDATTFSFINPYPTAFPYGNGMVLHFYQQQESSTTKTVHKVINKGLKTYIKSLHTGENFH